MYSTLHTHAIQPYRTYVSRTRKLYLIATWRCWYASWPCTATWPPRSSRRPSPTGTLTRPTGWRGCARSSASGTRRQAPRRLPLRSKEQGEEEEDGRLCTTSLVSSLGRRRSNNKFWRRFTIICRTVCDIAVCQLPIATVVCPLKN